MKPYEAAATEEKGEGRQHALSTSLNRGRVHHFSDFSPGMQLKGHSTIHHDSLAIRQRNGGMERGLGGGSTPSYCRVASS